MDKLWGFLQFDGYCNYIDTTVTSYHALYFSKLTEVKIHAEQY